MASIWTAHRQLIDSKTVRVSVSAASPLSVFEVLTLWRDNAAFRDFFTACVRGSGFDSYFWETPPVTEASLGRAFEFVVVEGRALERLQPDPGPFSGHFAAHPAAGVLSFPNLRGDAILIVPAPLSSDASCYTHLGRFLRDAPAAQIDSLWRTVGVSMSHRDFSAPVWMSTAGMGVSWLHLRLDSRPKYYRHRPYAAHP